MTPLRQRMAKYYRRDPAGYSASEVQAYLLHMVKDRHVSFRSMNQTACAARFLYGTVLGHDREQLHIPMAKVPVTQPELLSREEIARLFATCTNHVYRMILQTIYATGLRVFEACALRVRDTDSAPDRMCIRVENGKGAKTRYTLLSPTLRELLRAYVRRTKTRDWLFCARGGRRPLSVKSAQRAYWGARDGSGIIKRGGVHTLRHASAQLSGIVGSAARRTQQVMCNAPRPSDPGHDGSPFTTSTHLSQAGVDSNPFLN
jgi:integrase/recombinase XerD